MLCVSMLPWTRFHVSPATVDANARRKTRVRAMPLANGWCLAGLPVCRGR